MSTLLFCTYSSARYRSSCVWLKATACAGNLSVTLLDAERTALCFSLPLTCNTLTPTQFSPVWGMYVGRVGVCLKVWLCFFHLSRRSSSLSRLCSVGMYSATEFVTGAFFADGYTQSDRILVFFHTSAEEQTLTQFNFWHAEWADHWPSFSYFLLKSMVMYEGIGCDSN